MSDENTDPRLPIDAVSLIVGRVDAMDRHLFGEIRAIGGKVDTLHQDVSKLSAEVAALNATVQGHDLRIRQNGTLLASVEARVGSLERWRAWALGAAGTAGALLTQAWEHGSEWLANLSSGGAP